jgi:hypothetical protein
MRKNERPARDRKSKEERNSFSGVPADATEVGSTGRSKGEAKNQKLRSDVREARTLKEGGADDDEILAHFIAAGRSRAETADILTALERPAESDVDDVAAASQVARAQVVPQPQQLQQAQAGEGSDSHKQDNKETRRETARDDAFQILRDRKQGKSDEEITELMKNVGYSEEDIAYRFKFASDIAHSQEIKPLREKGRKAMEALDEVLKKREEEGASHTPPDERPDEIPFEPTQPMDPLAAEREADEQASIDERIEESHEGVKESSAREEEEELAGLYPDQQIPQRVLLTYLKFDRDVRESVASGDEEAQKKAMNRLDEFMRGQREMRGTDEATSEDLPPPLYEYHETRPAAAVLPVTSAKSAQGGITVAEAHALSEAKTRPYDENAAFVDTLPVRAKTAYWKLEDEVQAAVASGDEAAQQKAMTRLDEFIRVRGGETTGSADVSEDDKDLLAIDEDEVDAPEAVPSTVSTPQELERQQKIDEALSRSQREDWMQAMPEVEEKTPLEWRKTLRGLIEGAKEKSAKVVEKTKEKVQWWKGAEEGLIRRREELDREAEKIGGVENLFRALGERYNQYGWKTKLAIGASLGIGATAFASASVPLALACLSGVAAQRVAGLSTMYLKFEKSALDKKEESQWLKEKAMAKALLYTVGFGLVEKEAITLASESAPGQAIQEWLGRMLGHHGASPMAKVETHTPQPAAPHPIEAASHPTVTASAPEAPASAAQAPQPAAAASAIASESGSQPAVARVEASPSVPSEVERIDVAASKGHGYEYMTKRLWEQLQEKHVTLPSGANPDSDLAKLLAATPEDIDKVVHKLAQENEFFKGTGESVRIGLDSHMTIDTNGNILLSDAMLTDEATNLAPDAAPVTPAYHAEAPAVAAQSEMHAGTPVDSSPASANSAGAGSAGTGTSGEKVTAVQAQSVIPGDVIEKQPPAPLSDHDFMVNKYDVTIPLAEPHIYSAGKELVVYGGSSKDQSELMLRFLTKTPDATVLSSDDAGKYRIPWKLEGGKLVPGAPLKTGGLLGFLNPFLAPPRPEEFTKVVQ